MTVSRVAVSRVAVARVALVVLVAIAVGIAAAGCSKDETSPTVGPALSTDRPSSVAPPPSVPATTTSAVVASGPSGCGTAPAPASVRASQISADVDGDGTADTVIVYGAGTDAAPAPYHVQVQLGGGKGTVDAVIPDAGDDTSAAVKVLGAADVTASAGAPPDGSGAEVFVDVGSGAATAVIGIFQVTGCNLARLTGPGPNVPSAFAIGGTVTILSGLRCDGTAGGQRLVVLSAQSDDGLTYQTTEQRLDVTNGVFVASGDPVAGSVSSSDPQFQSFSHLDCPGVEGP